MVRPSALLVCGVAVAALGLSACGSDPEPTASAGAEQTPAFQGANAEFCAALLTANERSAAAEAAKAANDPGGVQTNATEMYAALSGAVSQMPDDASGDVKKALKKYVKTLERAMAGEELGDQARDSVKKTTKTISKYYDKDCRLAE